MGGEKTTDQVVSLLKSQKVRAAQVKDDLKPANESAQNLADALWTYKKVESDLAEARRQVREIKKTLVGQALCVARLRIEAEKSWSRHRVPVLSIKAIAQSPIYPDFFGSPKFELSLHSCAVFGGPNLNWKADFDHDGNNPHFRYDPQTLIYNALRRLLLSVDNDGMERSDDDISIVAKYFDLVDRCDQLVWRGEVYDLSK